MIVPPDANYLRFSTVYRIELIYETNIIESRGWISRHVACMYDNSDCAMVNRLLAGANRKIITALALQNTKLVGICGGGVRCRVLLNAINWYHGLQAGIYYHSSVIILQSTIITQSLNRILTDNIIGSLIILRAKNLIQICNFRQIHKKKYYDVTCKVM